MESGVGTLASLQLFYFSFSTMERGVFVEHTLTRLAVPAGLLCASPRERGAFVEHTLASPRERGVGTLRVSTT